MEKTNKTKAPISCVKVSQIYSIAQLFIVLITLCLVVLNTFSTENIEKIDKVLNDPILNENPEKPVNVLPFSSTLIENKNGTKWNLLESIKDTGQENRADTAKIKTKTFVALIDAKSIVANNNTSTAKNKKEWPLKIIKLVNLLSINIVIVIIAILLWSILHHLNRIRVLELILNSNCDQEDKTENTVVDIGSTEQTVASRSDQEEGLKVSDNEDCNKTDHSAIRKTRDGIVNSVVEGKMTNKVDDQGNCVFEGKIEGRVNILAPDRNGDAIESAEDKLTIDSVVEKIPIPTGCEEYATLNGFRDLYYGLGGRWRGIAEEIFLRKKLLTAARIDLVNHLKYSEKQAVKLAATDVFMEKAQYYLTRRAGIYYASGIFVGLITVLVLLMTGVHILNMDIREYTNGLEMTTQNTVLIVLKSITASSFILAIVYLMGGITRALLHEAASNLSKRHALRFSRLYIYLKDGNISAEEARDVLKWNEEFGSAFKDINADKMTRTVWTKLLDAAVEIAKSARKEGDKKSGSEK